MDKEAKMCWALVLKMLAILLWRSIYTSHIDEMDFDHKQVIQEARSMILDLRRDHE